MMHGAENIVSMPMNIFVGLMVVIGFFQRHQRWNEFKQGILWHSQSEGISRISSILPINESLCNRYIDPAICFVIGVIIILTISDYLGGYLIFCSLMLLNFEIALQELRIERLLDRLDGFCDAEASEKELAFHTRETTGEATQQATLSREDTAGIAPDIEAHIHRRRNRPPTPDDLV